MSVPVDPGSIGEFMRTRPFAYVLSISVDRIHAIAVRVEPRDDHLDCSLVGRSTRRNIAENPNVTVVFPPGHDVDDEYGKYSLVIDGSAVERGDRVLVTVRSAVLHRPA
jgi:hypothetical protein